MGMAARAWGGGSWGRARARERERSSRRNSRCGFRCSETKGLERESCREGGGRERENKPLYVEQRLERERRSRREREREEGVGGGKECGRWLKI